MSAKPEPTNPWGLTRREVEVMAAICEQGCHKLAASALGISKKTIEAHSHNAGQKMPQRTYLARALAFDRWLRTAPPPCPPAAPVERAPRSHDSMTAYCAARGIA